VIDPETPVSAAQLPLAAGFLEPGTSTPRAEAPIDSTPHPPADAALQELIRHFREVARRQELARPARGDRVTAWRARFQRWFAGIVHGVMPPAKMPAPPLPRISIVIPLHDRIDGLDDTIATLTAQAYPDLEIILVLGAGRRDPAGAMATSAARLVTVTVGRADGLSTALQHGFACASGEVLAWIDPETRALPGTLDRVAAHFRVPGRNGVLRFDLIHQVSGWRFAAEPGLDHRAIFFSRLGYDVAGGWPQDLVDGLSPAVLSARLWQAITARYDATHLPIPAAVVPGGDEPALQAAEIVLENAPTPDFWFAPDLPRAVPVQEAASPAAPTACPVTGALPSRFLFASPDIRFGTPGLHDLWYHQDTHCVTASPVLSRSDVRRLAAQPPLAERRIIEPEPDAPSPWRDWTFATSLLGFALRHPLPGWLLDRWPFKRLIGWTDRTGAELERAVRGFLPRPGKKGQIAPRMLEIACHSGDILDHAHRLGWKTFGTEINVAAAEAARAKGHTIWAGAPDDVLQTVPVEERFDVIFLGHVLERQADPLGLVQRAARLLSRSGVMVVATPNLDSAQLSLFGPTWAHWHPPHHRVVMSRRTLAAMAAASGLQLRQTRTWSHPYWTWLSLRLNRAGLSGIVPNGISPDAESRTKVETMIVACSLLYNWRGRGDYLYAVMTPDLGF
jgi:SAM-dependent methyltransferase